MQINTVVVELYTRKRTFIILRYVLVVAGAYLFLWSERTGPPNNLLGILIALALASNVILGALPEQRLFSIPGFVGLVLVDISWISAGLVVTSNVGGDLLLLYFLVLLCAAAAESLVLVTGTAVLAGIAYLTALATGGHGAAVLTTPNLMRVPFLFATALACGYLLEELKRERRHRQHMAEVERMRTEALTAAMKDIESPLQAMASALDELARNKLAASPRGVKRVLSDIFLNLGHMSLLINNYLDFAKIGEGLVPDGSLPQSVDLADVIDSVKKRFTPFAQRRNIKLAISNGALPPVAADRQAVEHIIANLVYNAIKYSPRGGTVQITASSMDRWAEIRVVDASYGTESGRISALFSPNVVAERDGEDHHTSLGLHLARHLTRLSKGSINVESQPGCGTRFSVRLPVGVMPVERQSNGATGGTPATS